MKLYLGSCDLGNNEQELKKWIEKNGRNIILIPNALDYLDDYNERKEIIFMDKIMLESVGFECTVKSLEGYFENNKRLIEEFRDCHAFYVIGGNVFTLRKAMELSGFDKFIQGLAKKDNYLYAGYSAGICVLTRNIGIYDFVDPIYNPYDGDLFIDKGLGIIDFIPIPHYKADGLIGDRIETLVDYCKGCNEYITIKDSESVIKEV